MGQLQNDLQSSEGKGYIGLFLAVAKIYHVITMLDINSSGIFTKSG